MVVKKEDLGTKLRLKKIFVDKYVTTERNRLREILNSLVARPYLSPVRIYSIFF